MVLWVILILSIFFLLMGYMIKFKLTAGFSGDETEESVSSKMAIWLGSQWLFLGIFGFVMIFIGLFIPEMKIKLLQGFLIMTVIVILRIQRGSKKFH